MLHSPYAVKPRQPSRSEPVYRHAETEHRTRRILGRALPSHQQWRRRSISLMLSRSNGSLVHSVVRKVSAIVRMYIERLKSFDSLFASVDRLRLGRGVRTIAAYTPSPPLLADRLRLGRDVRTIAACTPSPLPSRSRLGFRIR